MKFFFKLLTQLAFSLIFLFFAFTLFSSSVQAVSGVSITEPITLTPNLIGGGGGPPSPWESVTSSTQLCNDSDSGMNFTIGITFSDKNLDGSDFHGNSPWVSPAYGSRDVFVAANGGCETYTLTGNIMSFGDSPMGKRIYAQAWAVNNTVSEPTYTSATQLVNGAGIGATIAVVLSDPSGSKIANATVRIANAGQNRSPGTQELGNQYWFYHLDCSSWSTISISAPGFNSTTYSVAPNTWPIVNGNTYYLYLTLTSGGATSTPTPPPPTGTPTPPPNVDPISAQPYCFNNDSKADLSWTRRQTGLNYEIWWNGGNINVGDISVVTVNNWPPNTLITWNIRAYYPGTSNTGPITTSSFTTATNNCPGATGTPSPTGTPPPATGTPSPTATSTPPPPTGTPTPPPPPPNWTTASTMYCLNSTTVRVTTLWAKDAGSPAYMYLTSVLSQSSSVRFVPTAGTSGQVVWDWPRNDILSSSLYVRFRQDTHPGSTKPDVRDPVGSTNLVGTVPNCNVSPTPPPPTPTPPPSGVFSVTSGCSGSNQVVTATVASPPGPGYAMPGLIANTGTSFSPTAGSWGNPYPINFTFTNVATVAGNNWRVRFDNSNSALTWTSAPFSVVSCGGGTSTPTLTPTPPPSSGTIHIRVRGGDGSGFIANSFVSGATVKVLNTTNVPLAGQVAISDSLGWVTFNNVPAGPVHMIAYKSGFDGKWKQQEGSCALATPLATLSSFGPNATTASILAAYDDQFNVVANVSNGCNDLGLVKQPDYSLLLSPATQQANAGGSVPYSLSINPVSCPWPSSITVNLTYSYSINDGKVTIQKTPPPGAPDSSVTLDCSTSKLIGITVTVTGAVSPGGSYTLTVDGSGTGIPAHQATAALTINAGNWLQTLGGDLYSLGNAVLAAPPPTGQFTADYLVKTSGVSGSKITSAKNWKIDNYGSLSTQTSYDELKSQAGGSSILPLTESMCTFTSSTKPTVQGVRVCGPVTVSLNKSWWAQKEDSVKKRLAALFKNSLPGIKQVDANSTGLRETLIFVEGDMTINSNLDYSGNQVALFIVKGKIRISHSVSLINAYLFAQSGITTSYDSQVSSPQLVINGGVAVGSSAGLGDINFNRQTSLPQTSSAEKIIYDPRILVGFTDVINNRLGGSGLTFQETNP